MSEDTVQPLPWRRRTRQWGPFVLVGVLCLVLFGVDGRLKRGAPGGMVAKDATWRLEASDLPALWTQWENLEACEALREFAPPFMQDFSVALRIRSGVRPTPQRFGFWLGQGAVLSGNGASWCLSVRPGVAMRVATAMHRLVAAPAGPSVLAWGDCAYGWRDDFLLIGSSADYVAMVMSNGALVPFHNPTPDAIALSWTGEEPGLLQVEARSGLPFALELTATQVPQAGGLRYTQAWPDAAVLLNTKGADTLDSLRKTADRLLSPLVAVEEKAIWTTLAYDWWSTQMPPVPALSCVMESAWAFFPSRDDREQTAVRIGRRFHGCGPEYLASIGELDNARPYRWDDRKGWLVTSPRYGETYSVAQEGDAIAWANDTAMVPQLLDGVVGEALPGEMYLRAQWKPVTNLGKNLVFELAEDELLPGYNGDDIRNSWWPYLDAFGAWGALVATGEVRDDGLHIEGHLAATDSQ